jgi:hypothetical protein
MCLSGKIEDLLWPGCMVLAYLGLAKVIVSEFISMIEASRSAKTISGTSILASDTSGGS